MKFVYDYDYEFFGEPYMQTESSFSPQTKHSECVKQKN